MGLFLLSLESGFFVLCSCQIDQCFISILLRYLSLSESGGKDKTMMMNMMTGAVAINGGVGVMEVRQPQMVEKAVQDAGHIAADIAENAHITLHELKEKIDAVVEKKLPSFKALMEMKPMAVAQTTVDDASLTVYQNGYAVYEMDDAHTVIAVDRCGDYRYDFTDGTYQVVPAETFEETEWSVRLLMEGERRMEHNRNNRTAETENVSLECDGSDWSAAVMVDFLDEDNAEMLADRELRRLYAAMSKLTERQSEILQLYFYKGMNQYEIAEELGICQQSVNRLLADAKFFCNLVLVHTFIKVKLKDLRLALSQLAHGCIQAAKFPVCQHLGIILIQKIHHDSCRPVGAITFQGHIFSLSSTVIPIVLHPAFPFHEQTNAPLGLLKSLSRHYLICTICKVITVITTAIHCNDRVCVIHLVDRIAVLVNGQGSIIHGCLCNSHRFHLHQCLETRQLLFHHCVNLFL